MSFVNQTFVMIQTGSGATKSCLHHRCHRYRSGDVRPLHSGTGPHERVPGAGAQCAERRAQGDLEYANPIAVVEEIWGRSKREAVGHSMLGGWLFLEANFGF